MLSAWRRTPRLLATAVWVSDVSSAPKASRPATALTAATVATWSARHSGVQAAVAALYRDRAVGSSVGAGQRGHVPGRGEPAGRLSGGDQPPRQVVDIAANLGHPHLLVAHEPEPEPARPLGHVLMDLVAGESGQPLLLLDDHHLRAVAADPLEDAVGEREEVVRRAEAHITMAAVTATPRKRQGAAPWPTCMI